MDNAHSTCVLEAMVHQAIERHPHLVGRQVQLETSEGCVTLRGVVRSYYQKQMAQEILRGIHGVARIDNQLEVDW